MVRSRLSDLSERSAAERSLAVGQEKELSTLLGALDLAAPPRPIYASYLIGDLPNTLVDPLPPFDKKVRVAGGGHREMKEAQRAYMAEVKERKERQRWAAKAKRVRLDTAGSVLRTSAAGWQGRNAGYGKAVAPEHVPEDVLLEYFERFVDFLRLFVLLIRFLTPRAEGSDELLVVTTADGFRILVRSTELPGDLQECLTSFTAWAHEPAQKAKLATPPNMRGTHTLTLVGTTRAYSEVRLGFTPLRRAR